MLGAASEEDSEETYEYVEKPSDSLICSICHDVFRDPYCTPCGHSFCLTCLQDYLKEQGKDSALREGDYLCPLDRNNVTEFTPAPRAFREVLDEIKVRCTNPDCTWEGTRVAYTASHRCPHALCPCQNKGCHERIKRGQLKAHQELCAYRTAFCSTCHAFYVHCDGHVCRLMDMFDAAEDRKDLLRRCLTLTQEQLLAAVVDGLYETRGLASEALVLGEENARMASTISALEARVDDLEISAMTVAESKEKEKAILAQVQKMVDERDSTLQLRHAQYQLSMQVTALSQQVALLGRQASEDAKPRL